MIVSAALIQSVTFLPLILGIYLSYKILKITDLTVDGSYVLGGAIYARALTEGISPILSLLLALMGGFLAGTMVSTIQYKEKINSLIAGILALFMLYSINFQVMGRPNINMQNFPSLVNVYGDNVILKVSLFTVILLWVLLLSPMGLQLKGFGQNKNLLQRIGCRVELLRCLGLGASNMFAALCGILSCQLNGYADINMGFGVTLIGIGAVVIGLELVKYLPMLKNSSTMQDILGCFLGGLLYFMALNGLLSVGISPMHLKLCLGTGLVFFLRAANLSQQANQKVQYV